MLLLCRTKAPPKSAFISQTPVSLFIWGKTCCFKNLSFQNLAYFVLDLGLFVRSLAYVLKQKFFIFFETTGFETTGFSTYILCHIIAYANMI